MTDELKIWAEAVCRKSGVAKFVGPFMSDYLIFTSMKTGSSLALKVSDFNVDSVREHTASNDRLFEKRA